MTDEYLKILGLLSDADSCKRKQALTRAYALRSFEIEHYWKRATYFWGFQIAIFAAIGIVWKDQSDLKSLLALSLAGLGVITAWASFLSARGSRFWQRNWERHIDMLEDEFEGGLHKTVWLQKGKNSYSVSRLNQVLSFCLFVFWIMVGGAVAARCLGWPLSDIRFRDAFVGMLIVLTIAAVAALAVQVTDLEGAIIDMRGKELPRCCRFPWSTRLARGGGDAVVRRRRAE